MIEFQKDNLEVRITESPFKGETSIALFESKDGDKRLLSQAKLPFSVDLKSKAGLWIQSGFIFLVSSSQWMYGPTIYAHARTKKIRTVDFCSFYMVCLSCDGSPRIEKLHLPHSLREYDPSQAKFKEYRFTKLASKLHSYFLTKTYFLPLLESLIFLSSTNLILKIDTRNGNKILFEASKPLDSLIVRKKRRLKQ